MKKYILIAGVNGAGKSTLYYSLQSLQDMPRVNTDEILRGFGDWRNCGKENRYCKEKSSCAHKTGWSWHYRAGY